MGMLEDMSIAVRDLSTVKFKVVFVYSYSLLTFIRRLLNISRLSTRITRTEALIILDVMR